jgi:acyl-CoA synthetase (AMP-forming)/AMP-acid ligase II
VTGRSYTYGEARAAAERLSVSLPASAGLHPGDTLGMVMPNMPEYPLTLLGATAAGLVVSPANPVYTPGNNFFYILFYIKIIITCYLVNTV